MENKIKIAFDVHGVITSDPERYKILMNELVRSELFEVWIVSGPREKPVVKELESLGIYERIHWHRIDTIVEHLLRTGDEYTLETINGVEHYYFEEWKWDTAKADICYTNDINILIDDTKAYQRSFGDSKTHFILKE